LLLLLDAAAALRCAAVVHSGGHNRCILQRQRNAADDVEGNETVTRSTADSFPTNRRFMAFVTLGLSVGRARPSIRPLAQQERVRSAEV